MATFAIFNYQFDKIVEHARPNASKHFYYGWLYEENGRYFIKMNLQIRSK